MFYIGTFLYATLMVRSFGYENGTLSKRHFSQ